MNVNNQVVYSTEEYDMVRLKRTVMFRNNKLHLNMFFAVSTSAVINPKKRIRNVDGSIKDSVRYTVTLKKRKERKNE